MKLLILVAIISSLSLIEATKYIVHYNQHHDHHDYEHKKPISYTPRHTYGHSYRHHEAHSGDSTPHVYTIIQKGDAKPHKIIIKKPVPYTVYKRVPYPVKVPIKVPVVQKVEVQVPQPYQVTVFRPYPVEVPYEVIVEKKVPTFVKSGDSRGSANTYDFKENYGSGSDAGKDVSDCGEELSGYDYPKPSAGYFSHR